MEAHCDGLWSIEPSESARQEMDACREELQRDFERALAETRLPERPNYEKANEFLIRTRRQQAK